MENNQWRHAETYLSQKDQILAKIIEKVGPCRLKRKGTYFSSLCDSIIYQQLSIRVADLISERFNGLFSRGLAVPRELVAFGFEELRSVGLSTQKINYLWGVAEEVISGHLNLEILVQEPRADIEEKLLQLKGVGPWTVTMFLIFGVNHPDILPVGDLGIKKAVQFYYQLPQLPTPGQVSEIGEKWEPYRTVATWYLWQGLRMEKEGK